MRAIRKIAQAVKRLAGRTERRLHLRALSHWHAARGGREFPVCDEFDFLRLEDHATHGFLIDLSDASQPMVIHVGAVLREEAELGEVPVRLDDIAPPTLLGQFGRRWEEVRSARQPVMSEYDFVTEAAYQVRCRGVLLPLSSDGTSIDRVHGIITWKSEKVDVAPSLAACRLDGEATGSLLDPAGKSN